VIRAGNAGTIALSTHQQGAAVLAGKPMPRTFHYPRQNAPSIRGWKQSNDDAIAPPGQKYAGISWRLFGRASQFLPGRRLPRATTVGVNLPLAVKQIYSWGAVLVIEWFPAVIGMVLGYRATRSHRLSALIGHCQLNCLSPTGAGELGPVVTWLLFAGRLVRLTARNCLI